MKTICAYCLHHISGNRKDERISHGMCPTCQKKVIAGQDFIRHGVGLPVIWIDKKEGTMKFNDIEIPDSEVEKRQNREKAMLQLLYEAHPDFAVTTWTLNRAGGTGFSARKQTLNEWLETYGLTIEKENRSSPKGAFYIYWIAETGNLFKGAPRKFIGEVA